MENLRALWLNHRLGLLYGALWALAPMIIREQIPLFNYDNGPDDFKRLPMEWGGCFVMLIASLPTGVAVTWLFRRLLKGSDAMKLFLWSPLALLIGTTLFGFLFAQFGWLMLNYAEPYGQLTLVSMWLHPLLSFGSFAGVFLIPLAGLNTWDLWRRVNCSSAP
jgi:hypothetical protein